MKLKSLFLKFFRGATQPVTIDFDSSKKITMIFGENGNGKSTISDALICLLTDYRGSLDDKSSVDISFLKSLGAGDSTITLETDTNTFSATLSGSAKQFTKNPPSGLPAIRFLRRSQIIKLMDAQANGRYETLKDYIDVSGVYTSEEELRKALRETEQNLSTSISLLHQAHTTLEQIWISENKPEEDYIKWANAQSLTDLSKEQKDLQILNDLLFQFKSTETKYKEVSRAIISARASKNSKLNAEKRLKEAQAENNKINSSLLKLLQEAKIYISGQQQIDKCPVCDNDINKTKVIDSLDLQIKSMSELDQATQALNVATKAHERNIAIYKTSIQVLSNHIIKYRNSIQGYKSQLPEITAFVDGIGQDPKVNYDCYINNISQIQALNAKIEASQKKKNKNIEQHNSIKQNFKVITDNTEKVGKLTALKASLSKALSIVEKERKDFYDNELLSISGEVEQMYQKLHPREGLGGIKLYLNPKYKTSLELEADFHTEKGITPQSVYSESHLDTLGICIFLALAKKYSDGNTILILDDVVMSVDENHLDRFIDLLHDEAVNFGQIIITTHYRPWRDRYRNNRAPAGNVHFLELRNWTMANGIRVYNGKLVLDELKELVNDPEKFDRENIASTSGRMLENILDYLTLKYSCRLQRKPKSDYQLSELLDAFSKKLLDVMKVEHYSKDGDGKMSLVNEVALKPIFEKLKELKTIRNQVGAHFNFDGSLVSDADIIEFGKLTIELADLLIDPINGSLPDRNKSGSYWETKSDLIRLYPLIEPK